MFEESRVTTVHREVELKQPGVIRRTKCGACQSGRLHQFLNLGDSPLADAFPKDSSAIEPRYSLELTVCEECWLVQMVEVVPDHLLFGTDYGFFTSANPSLNDYYVDYVGHILANYRKQAERLTVEIACNDGMLLKRFKIAGCEVLGVDPATNVVEEARKRGLSVLNEPFGLEVAKRIREVQGKRAGLIIANNVVAHVSDLNDFFAGLKELLAEDGVLVIEFQYLGDLLLGNQFDHVYHEHRSFFSFSSFESICKKHDLEIRDVIQTPAQGGSLRVFIGGGVKDHRRSTIIRRNEAWLRELTAYDGFQGRVNHLRTRLLDILESQIRKNKRIAGYAASAKSTTLLNFCDIDSSILSYIEDITPHKIGRVSPGTHIPILAPGQSMRPDAYLVMAWNYLPGILHRERDYIEKGGKFIVPIPMPIIL